MTVLLRTIATSVLFKSCARSPVGLPYSRRDKHNIHKSYLCDCYETTTTISREGNLLFERMKRNEVYIHNNLPSSKFLLCICRNPCPLLTHRIASRFCTAQHKQFHILMYKLFFCLIIEIVSLDMLFCFLFNNLQHFI